MKLKKKYIKASIIIGMLIIGSYFIYNQFTKDPYQIGKDSFTYSKYRAKPEYSMFLINETDTTNTYKIIFKSRNFMQYETKIHALLIMPKTDKKVPAVVYLPGGGVPKEGVIKQAELFSKKNIATLILDQRGIGETGGMYLGFEQDYEIFRTGKEPIQHLSVYDALAGFDVLRTIKSIDKDKIAIAGESMGGRYAIIATAQDDRIKGTLILSSSGFNIKKDTAQTGNDYMLSIDPDQYVGKISPRKIIMVHGTNDTTIRIESGINTFNKATEPKKFYTIDGCGHGFCKEMETAINEAIDNIFQY